MRDAHKALLHAVKGVPSRAQEAAAREGTAEHLLGDGVKFLKELVGVRGAKVLPGFDDA